VQTLLFLKGLTRIDGEAKQLRRVYTGEPQLPEEGGGFQTGWQPGDALKYLKGGKKKKAKGVEANGHLLAKRTRYEKGRKRNKDRSKTVPLSHKVGGTKSCNDWRKETKKGDWRKTFAKRHSNSFGSSSKENKRQDWNVKVRFSKKG